MIAFKKCMAGAMFLSMPHAPHHGCHRYKASLKNIENVFRWAVFAVERPRYKASSDNQTEQTMSVCSV